MGRCLSVPKFDILLVKINKGWKTVLGFRKAGWCIIVGGRTSKGLSLHLEC